MTDEPIENDLENTIQPEHGLADPTAEALALPPSRTLREAAARLDLEIADTCYELLEAYCHALWEWNTKINLTRHTDFDLFARRDLLDSVHLAKHLEPDHEVLDIGTGGGVPGIVLGILRPDLTISLCDSVAKKSKVVSDIVQRLDLPIAVYASKAQDVLDDLRFHTLVTRAAGSISQLMTWVKDYWLSFDSLLAIKGPRWVEERKEARHRGLLNGIELRRVEAYKMPATKSESVILQFRKNR
ncbi:MAG: 16S rRNA (guanine(527)-N(7))-methyltransferase RsmG [Pirellulaceae bacterium]